MALRTIKSNEVGFLSYWDTCFHLSHDQHPLYQPENLSYYRAFSAKKTVENPIDRYSIGDRSTLQYAKDGSLTIYIRHDSPGKQHESNWLPAPDGPFSVQFRMYLPKAEALNPLYLPPAITVSR